MLIEVPALGRLLRRWQVCKSFVVQRATDLVFWLTGHGNTRESIESTLSSVFRAYPTKNRRLGLALEQSNWELFGAISLFRSENKPDPQRSANGSETGADGDRGQLPRTASSD